MLELAKKAISRYGRHVQEAVFEAEKILFEKMATENGISAPLDTLLVEYAKMLFGQEDTAEPVRVKATGVIAAIAVRARKGTQLRALLEQEIVAVGMKDPSISVQHGLDHAREALARSGGV